MVDRSLISACIRKDPKAQYELYRKLYPMMMSICSRYERNRQDAAATMNQGFLRVLDGLGDRRPDVPFEPWVRRVVINTVIDNFRRQQQRKRMETTDVPLENESSDEANEYLSHMEAEAFAELLLNVPPMSRNVFNLFAIDGHSHAEIAQLLGISEGTSKWHVSNARAILRTALARMAAANAQTAAR